MPGAKSIHGLESVVIGRANTIFLKDVAGIRKLREKRPDSTCAGWVYIGHYVQLASFAAYVADLDDRRVPQALFDLQAIVVKIRRAEILVHGIRGENVAATVWICGHVECSARLDVGKDRGASRLRALPVIPGQRVVRDGVWPNRVILQTVGGVGWWPEIQKWVDIDLIVENTKTSSNDHIVLGLIGKT